MNPELPRDTKITHDEEGHKQVSSHGIIRYSTIILNMLGRICFDQKLKLYPYQVCDCERKCGQRMPKYNAISYCYRCMDCHALYCICHFLYHEAFISKCSRKEKSKNVTLPINKAKYNKLAATCTQVEDVNINLNSLKRESVEYIGSHYLRWLNVKKLTVRNGALEAKEIMEITSQLSDEDNILESVNL